MNTNPTTSRNARRYALLAAAIVAAFVLGSLLQPIAAIDAQTRFSDVQTSPQQPAFQSGGARGVPVLDEILATLRRIDGRLERLETKVFAPPER
jgi:hypothetical protein